MIEKLTDEMRARIRHKFDLMRSCPYFGHRDGMNGSCHYCYEENEERWQLCEYFTSTLPLRHFGEEK